MNSCGLTISPIQKINATPERNVPCTTPTSQSAVNHRDVSCCFSPIIMNNNIKSNPEFFTDKGNGISSLSILNTFNKMLVKSPSAQSEKEMNINVDENARICGCKDLDQVERDDRNEDNRDSRPEETSEERLLREEAESEALARQLMAEEAMASYNQSALYLQENAEQYSEEDLAALRAIMDEEHAIEEAEEEELVTSADLSYETLLNLGERMGDVKSERWAMRAKREIAKLSTATFKKSMVKGKDENDCDVKCLVCQFPFEDGEGIRILPCKHYFHHECVDQWLMAKDFCPYCRQCIVAED